MSNLAIAAVALILVAVVVANFLTRRREGDADSALAEAPATLNAPAEPEPLSAALERLIDGFRESYDKAVQPVDAIRHADFQAGVALLAEPSTPLGEALEYGLAYNDYITNLLGEALCNRPDAAAAVEPVVAYLDAANPWPMYSLLRFLAAAPVDEVVGKVLSKVQWAWSENVHQRRALRDFIEARLAAGEHIDLVQCLEELAATNRLPVLEAAIKQLDGAAGWILKRRVDDWNERRLDRGFLTSFGLLWEGSWCDAVAHHHFEAPVRAVVEAFEREPPQSVLLAGAAGAGKTAVVKLAAAQLMERGWHVFEASANAINAGQSYVGQLEGRIQAMLVAIEARRKVLWYVPSLIDLAYQGRHIDNPAGILDQVLPALKSGRIALLAESTDDALARVLIERPALRGSCSIVRLSPMASDDALALAQQVAECEFAVSGVSLAAPALAEALHLLAHHMPYHALPGSLLDLLRGAFRRALKRNSAAIERADLIKQLGELTGLPSDVLDDEHGLDTAALCERFLQRVMGQQEAVDCLVDRIAMLKAGLTDPRRPIGVFFFAGPTGTGKTELAKTLAAYLFGSPERLIRIDMSELHGRESLARIAGRSDDAGGESLAERIRRQPFSVMLLDEFEKADPSAWDLFLQVFDDGRLSDARGALADFRYSIIILTSNAGSREHEAGAIGFGERGHGAYSEQQVLRALRNTFRPEFINRIDRIVVFRPLSRAVMRDIVRKELGDLLSRRGLRQREWAIEWEESAIDFLLDKGFTVDLGARPLRRAIDSYLVAPLARAMAENQLPQGDQFLFVRSGGEAIEVDFVDPDAPEMPSVAAPPATTRTLAGLILSPQGNEAVRDYLAAELAAIDAQINGSAWQDSKQALYAQMNNSEFWDDHGRFAVLNRLEQLDRINAGQRAARSLGGRLHGRGAVPRAIVAPLALQLFLLRAALADAAAANSMDVYVMIEPAASDAGAGAAREHWLGRVVSMYRAWARKRHMRCEIDEHSGAPRTVLAISGLGAYHLLAAENGLHVLEIEREEASSLRTSVRVRVARQPAQAPAPQARLFVHSSAAFGPESGSPQVVRRYREHPTPLVRDSVRGWRSGRLDLVLGGDFDLLE